MHFKWQAMLRIHTCVGGGVAGAAPPLGRLPPVLARHDLLLLEVAQHLPQQLRVQPQLLCQARRLPTRRMQGFSACMFVVC